MEELGHQSARNEPCSVMIVDDNAGAGELLACLMELEGHSAAVFSHPSAALLAAQSGKYDAYILDIGLPDMDGYELVRRLRMLENGSRPVFIALTGYGEEEDKLLSKSAGFDFHLVKPVNIKRLNAILGSNSEGLRG